MALAIHTIINRTYNNYTKVKLITDPLNVGREEYGGPLSRPYEERITLHFKLNVLIDVIVVCTKLLPEL